MPMRFIHESPMKTASVPGPRMKGGSTSSSSSSSSSSGGASMGSSSSSSSSPSYGGVSSGKKPASTESSSSSGPVPTPVAAQALEKSMTESSAPQCVNRKCK